MGLAVGRVGRPGRVTPAILGQSRSVVGGARRRVSVGEGGQRGPSAVCSSRPRSRRPRCWSALIGWVALGAARPALSAWREIPGWGTRWRPCSYRRVRIVMPEPIGLGMARSRRRGTCGRRARRSSIASRPCWWSARHAPASAVATGVTLLQWGTGPVFVRDRRCRGALQRPARPRGADDGRGERRAVCEPRGAPRLRRTANGIAVTGNRGARAARSRRHCRTSPIRSLRPRAPPSRPTVLDRPRARSHDRGPAA